jgi:hypothetical protein
MQWGWAPGTFCALQVDFTLILAQDVGAEQTHDCFAQLKYRDIRWPSDDFDILPVHHAFWWVQDRTGTRHVISAGPQEYREGDRMVQYLEAWVVNGDQNGEDHADQALAWKSSVSADHCDSVDRMLADARAFPRQRIIYNPKDGPNSNSAARRFGRMGGFRPQIPLRVRLPGWAAHVAY